MTEQRRILDPRRLTMGDLRRLREALQGHPILKDDDGNPRDVSDVIETRDFVIVGTMCILADRLRTDSGFTWEQAEEIPLGDVEPDEEPDDEEEDGPGQEPDPLTGPGGSPGPELGTSGRPRRKPKQPAAASPSSSAPSTASTEPSLRP